MADITAKDVQELRKRTGAGMMDCKKALEETGGDSDAAAKLLAERGLAAAAKRSDRENNQGAVAVAEADGVAAMVELRCETDFVAKSPDFVAIVQELADAVAAKGEGAAEERKADIDALGTTLKENIALGRVVRFEAAPGNALDTYLHVQNGRGVNGVIVEVEGASKEQAHDVALTVAFNKPPYLSRDEVPESVVAEQREIAEAQARNEGKPEAAFPKIVEGKLTGYFKQVVLTDMGSAKDDKVSIAQMLGSGRVTRFAQVVVG